MIDPEILKEYNNVRPKGPRDLFCYAPFNGMIFLDSGEVASCCLSNERLAYYPEKTIKEIWFGEKFNTLRELITKNELPQHCDYCRMHLRQRNLTTVLASRYDYYQVNKNKYPAFMEFALGTLCNLECIMCNEFLSSSIRMKRTGLPPKISPYDKEFVRQLEEFIPYLHDVCFVGGEPFLINVYYEIWEKMLQLNPKINIVVTTNTTILNERVKDLLERGNFSINASIDSLQKEVYENIRINAYYEKTIENLKYFWEYCKRKNTSLNILVCPIRKNWQEYPDFVNLCNDLDITVFFMTVLKPRDLALWSLDKGKLKEIYKYLIKFDFPENTWKQKMNKRYYLSLTGSIKIWMQDAMRKDLEVTTQHLI